MMKKIIAKDYTLSWKEQTSAGIKEKGFDVCRKDLQWHMKNLKDAYPVCFDASYKPKES